MFGTQTSHREKRLLHFKDTQERSDAPKADQSAEGMIQNPEDLKSKLDGEVKKLQTELKKHGLEKHSKDVTDHMRNMEDALQKWQSRTEAETEKLSKELFKMIDDALAVIHTADTAQRTAKDRERDPFNVRSLKEGDPTGCQFSVPSGHEVWIYFPQYAEGSRWQHWKEDLVSIGSLEGNGYHIRRESTGGRDVFTVRTKDNTPLSVYVKTGVNAQTKEAEHKRIFTTGKEAPAAVPSAPPTITVSAKTLKEELSKKPVNPEEAEKAKLAAHLKTLQEKRDAFLKMPLASAKEMKMALEAYKQLKAFVEAERASALSNRQADHPYVEALNTVQGELGERRAKAAEHQENLKNVAITAMHKVLDEWEDTRKAWIASYEKKSTTREQTRDALELVERMKKAIAPVREAVEGMQWTPDQTERAQKLMKDTVEYHESRATADSYITAMKNEIKARDAQDYYEKTRKEYRDHNVGLIHKWAKEIKEKLNNIDDKDEKAWNELKEQKVNKTQQLIEKEYAYLQPFVDPKVRPQSLEPPAQDLQRFQELTKYRDELKNTDLGFRLRFSTQRMKRERVDTAERFRKERNNYLTYKQMGEQLERAERPERAETIKALKDLQQQIEKIILIYEKQGTYLNNTENSYFLRATGYENDSGQIGTALVYFKNYLKTVNTRLSVKDLSPEKIFKHYQDLKTRKAEHYREERFRGDRYAADVSWVQHEEFRELEEVLREARTQWKKEIDDPKVGVYVMDSNGQALIRADWKSTMGKDAEGKEKTIWWMDKGAGGTNRWIKWGELPVDERTTTLLKKETTVRLPQCWPESIVHDVDNKQGKGWLLDVEEVCPRVRNAKGWEVPHAIEFVRKEKEYLNGYRNLTPAQYEFFFAGYPKQKNVGNCGVLAALWGTHMLETLISSSTEVTETYNSSTGRHEHTFTFHVPLGNTNRSETKPYVVQEKDLAYDIGGLQIADARKGWIALNVLYGKLLAEFWTQREPVLAGASTLTPYGAGLIITGIHRGIGQQSQEYSRIVLQNMRGASPSMVLHKMFHGWQGKDLTLTYDRNKEDDYVGKNLANKEKKREPVEGGPKEYEGLSDYEATVRFLDNYSTRTHIATAVDIIKKDAQGRKFCHAYTIVDVDPKQKIVYLTNPWDPDPNGRYGVIKKTYDQFCQEFSSISFAEIDHRKAFPPLKKTSVTEKNN